MRTDGQAAVIRIIGGRAVAEMVSLAPAGNIVTLEVSRLPT